MGNGIETECLLLSAKNYILPTRQPKTLKANHFSLSTNYPLFLPFSFCASCFCGCSKRFEQPEKSCGPCGQSHLQSREIKFCLSVGFLAEQTRNLVAGIEIQYSGRYIPKNAGGVLSQKISLRRSSEIRHLNNLRYI